METLVSDTSGKRSLKNRTAAVFYLLSSPVYFCCDDKAGASDEDRVKMNNNDNVSSQHIKCVIITSSLFS